MPNDFSFLIKNHAQVLCLINPRYQPPNHRLSELMWWMDRVTYYHTHKPMRTNGYPMVTFYIIYYFCAVWVIQAIGIAWLTGG